MVLLRIRVSLSKISEIKETKEVARNISELREYWDNRTTNAKSPEDARPFQDAVRRLERTLLVVCERGWALR